MNPTRIRLREKPDSLVPGAEVSGFTRISDIFLTVIKILVKMILKKYVVKEKNFIFAIK